MLVEQHYLLFFVCQILKQVPWGHIGSQANRQPKTEELSNIFTSNLSTSLRTRGTAIR